MRAPRQNLASEEAKICLSKSSFIILSAKNGLVSEKITLFFSISRGGSNPKSGIFQFMFFNPSLGKVVLQNDRVKKSDFLKISRVKSILNFSRSNL